MSRLVVRSLNMFDFIMKQSGGTAPCRTLHETRCCSPTTIETETHTGKQQAQVNTHIVSLITPPHTHTPPGAHGSFYCHIICLHSPQQPDKS